MMCSSDDQGDDPAGLVIAVEGIPGSGKTTVMEAFGNSKNIAVRSSAAFTGIGSSWKASVMPRWDPWHHFWEKPEQNCEGYLRWRANMIREVCALRPAKNGALLMEGSVLPDYLALAALDSGYMTEFSVINYVSTEKMNTFHTDHPDYLVVLMTDPDVAWRRLLERGLPGDFRVTYDFLVGCHLALKKWLDNMSDVYLPRVFVIDNDGELESLPEVVGQVRERVKMMTTRRFRLPPRPWVYLDVPADPVLVPPAGATKTLLAHRATAHVYRLAPECFECRRPVCMSRWGRPNSSRGRPVPDDLYVDDIIV